MKGWLVGVSALLTFAACAPAPALFVHTARLGQTSEPEIGQKVRFERITKSDQVGHPTPGYSLIRGQQEWDVFFADHPQHAFATGIDFSTKMVLAGYSTDPKAVHLEAQGVIDAGPSLHVYFNQSLPGEGCFQHVGPAVFELVTIPRTEKAVHVHVDTVQDAACNRSRPGALMACRPAAAAPWAESKLSAKVGDTVECEASIKGGSRLVIDRGWTLVETPKGSQSKLEYQQGGVRVRFPLDALGHYRLRVSAMDEDGKRGEAEMQIETGTAEGAHAELFWTKVDKSVDPSTLPRGELHAVDANASAGKRDCSAGIKESERPTWCDAKKQGANALLRIAAAPPGRYTIFVRYLDDRDEKSPVACVRTLVGSKVISETCDPEKRKKGSFWELGVMDEVTGNFEGRGTFEARSVAKIEVDKPLPAELQTPELDRRYVAKYTADSQPIEGFRLPATPGNAQTATEVWAVLAEGPYAEWNRKFGPGNAPPALGKAAVAAVQAGLKVKMIVIESPRLTSAHGLGVGSTLAELTAKLGKKTPTKVPPLFGKDECAVDDGNVRYTFTDCNDAKGSGRVVRVLLMSSAK
jgi:hypothetical protein